MNNKNVVIIDSEICNLFNVKRAFEHVGANVTVSSDKKIIATADRVVLPGVGSFAEGMKGIYSRGIADDIKKFASTGRPLFGICLGMQLLMEHSSELGSHEGLGVVPGSVRSFAESSANPGPGYKIPHVGWNRLNAQVQGTKGFGDQTILSGISHGAWLYFVHSYVVLPKDNKSVIAHTEYGQSKFCSVFQHNNIFGCQGHPERSGPVGLRILKNFITL